LSVVLASAVQDEKVVEWSETSVLVWPVQPRLWFTPSPHGTVGSCHYSTHDDVPMSTDGDDFSIRTTGEMEKYESFRHREFAHTHVYDVNLFEKVGLDEELPTILRTIDWGKLYNEPRLGSRLLTL
jgi:hypothetical protein